jgi:hypothetical protein
VAGCRGAGDGAEGHALAMASLVVKPATPKEVVRVRLGEVQYTFFPGVPRDVPDERAPSLTTLLQAVEGTLASPTPTVTPTGTAGSTSYSYEVVAYNGNGDTLPSTAGTTTTGNATLSGTNYNALSWASATGATGYKVLRTVGGSTQGLIANVVTTTYNDQGATASSYTPVGSAVGVTTVIASMGEL